jgi:hypothetical protein
MTFEEFIAEVGREARARDRFDPSYSSHGSVMAATVTWLGGREGEEFREAISALVPPGDQIGPHTRKAVATIGSTAELNTTPPGRVVRLVTALALDRNEETS